MTQKAPEQSNLGKFGRHLRGVLGAAGGNRSSGDRLAHSLQLVGKHIDATLQQAEATNGKNPPSEAKLDRAAKVLESELKSLNKRYHDHEDRVRIEQFLNDQRDIISRSFEPSDDRDKHIATLDDRVGKLHGMMRAERTRIKQTVRKERIKFWVTFSLAITSVGLSLYALFSS